MPLEVERPPILPDIEKILIDYLICPERLPIHHYEQNQAYWSRKPHVQELFDCNKGLTHGMALKVLRDLNTGKITEFYQVSRNEVNANAKNSMSLHRSPAPSAIGVRGDSTYFPFWPGGFPDPLLNIPIAQVQEQTNNTDITLLTVPPGFKNGFQFEDISKESESLETNKNDKIDETLDTVDLMNLVQKGGVGEHDILGLWKEMKNESTCSVASKQEISAESNIDDDRAIIIEEEESRIPILNISKYSSDDSKSRNNRNGSEWAVMINVQEAVDDFKERIPELAYEYPFELDTFQKQAILKLEENCDVFVAAHTSAGKTVVAEYAIALSQKHKTRTIYTSPIKALSNQKYRDFKRTFEDVGLITGDFQINPTGVCLIMTTEILRSMLYCGSEVIRDLEYVIFDEVHYINDAERGHVWEEVLIMLPDHVRIVLLSATVPNTMEFASWLGMTKKRVVYVISTLHRPVPLQHYLYTGNGGRTRDERFLLIDANDRFLNTGYISASKAISLRSRGNNTGGGKDRMRQECTALIGLIDHLKRNELLPVVAFTFSRAMCDRMADSLRSVDLTTAKEKSKIHSFYEQCVKRLKQPDQNLPQIVNMKEILKNGIAVHHSGILPMIKEIVEMLFQNGLVKILFATETFAMGVNMPARTVIFNSIEKFDGTEKRYLKPAEYIQMAGRAGRRGKDTTGTVIIRCATSSDSLPDIQVLRDIMQGKPQKLESKFRLTYSMLLSLFRAESFSVETMMSHSFCEVQHVTKADELKVDLERSEKQLKQLQQLSQSESECESSANQYKGHSILLENFYKIASEYIEIWKQIQPNLMKQARYLKELVPGRVLLVSHKKHYKKLGILLSITKKERDQLVYKVLVLCNQNETKTDETKEEEEEADMPDNWYRMLSITHENIFQAEGIGGHCVLELPCIDFVLTNKIIKVDCELVLKDWDKRQIPRFQADAPGQTCQLAIQELTKLTNDFKEDYLNVDYRVNDIQLSQEIIALKCKQNELAANVKCTKIANFQHHFSTIFKRKHLEEKVDNLKFLLSSRSLSLYPDYISRVNILKELRYIDEENRVQMKGRVACEMGMNELLITELVLRNTLTNLQAGEVAALLSALVYQVRTNDEQSCLENLPENLKRGCAEIKAIHAEIKKLEDLNHVSSFQDLNFGLIEVVYEWAREKPFADIMCLTDVQEGIIVRCIQQLNETLKDVREAAQIIGDPVLKSKMEDASNAIKRDIVFAASLYTQREAANISS